MSNGIERFAFLGRGFVYIFGKIVSILVMTLINTNLVVSRLIKREKVSFPVAVHRSKTPLNFVCGNESVTHSAQSKFSWRKGIFFGIFCLEYLSRRSEEVDGHFATDFHFILLHFVLQTTVSLS